MRLSMDINDPGYHPLYRGASVEIDGVLVEKAVAADEEEGWADYLAADENGQVCFDMGTENFIVARRKGKVRILISEARRELIETDRKNGVTFRLSDGNA